MIPSPWPAVVLVLATHRVVRLAGWDTFPPLIWLRALLTGTHPQTVGTTNARMRLTQESLDVTYSYRWPTLAAGLACAYCSSLWFGTAIYVAWRLEPYWTLTVCVPFALSSAVGILSHWLDP